MKRLLNIGSINIDYVYRVPHFLRAGETLEADTRDIFMGGKGLNQTVAAARSGIEVAHAGVLGEDGRFLYDFIKSAGINVDFLRIDPCTPSGHTVIQVTPDAENAILYFAGTNHALTHELIASALDYLEKGDVVLLQNEVNDVAFSLTEAKKRELFTVFNPAPFSPKVLAYPLDKVDVLIVNETEAQGILGTEIRDKEKLLEGLKSRLPHALIFLTLGAKGMSCVIPDIDRKLHFNAYKVDAVDTTGAGDTFVGYAMRAVMSYFDRGYDSQFETLIQEAMLAAAVSVTRAGAVPSIPSLNELNSFKANHE